MSRKKHLPTLRARAATLKARLYCAGITQMDVARRAGFSVQMVSAVIRGERNNDIILKTIYEMTQDVNQEWQ